MPQGLVQPVNAILVAGTPLVEELEVKTATNMYPGRFVIRDDADYNCKVAGAGAKNVLGILDIDPKGEKAIGTIFEAEDQVRVLRGPIIVLGLLLDGETVVKGDALITKAGGKIGSATDISVTVPSGSTTVLSTAAQPNLTEAGSIPPGGDIVGYAAEGKAASGSDEKLMLYMAI